MIVPRSSKALEVHGGQFIRRCVDHMTVVLTTRSIFIGNGGCAPLGIARSIFISNPFQGNKTGGSQLLSYSKGTEGLLFKMIKH